MPVLEIRDIQNPVMRWARDAGILAIRFTPNGERGWPDTIFVFPNGKVVWIEFKVPNKPLKPLQEHRFNQLKEHRQSVYRVDKAEHGIAILQAELESQAVSKNRDSYADQSELRGYSS